jgi:head-tail adaptor
MALGRMSSFIIIMSQTPTQDAEGFVENRDTPLATVRAYREDKQRGEVWSNRAEFATATVLFRFRKVPDLTVTTVMVILCGDERYDIVGLA